MNFNGRWTTNADLEKLLMLDRPTICEQCKHPLFYVGLGEYRCEKCGTTALDNLGKVQAYLRENCNAGAFDIAEATGVDIDLIFAMVNDGSIKIVKNTARMSECQKCGKLTNKGRYCDKCTKQLAGEIKKTFHDDPRMRIPFRSDENTKIHFFNQNDWDNKL